MSSIVCKGVVLLNHLLVDALETMSPRVLKFQTILVSNTILSSSTKFDTVFTLKCY